MPALKDKQPDHIVDVAIIGAGAAGLMCGIECGKRGRKTIILDHAEKTAEKIRISGGGRCNFTNIYTSPEAFLSQNPHFCKSALKQFTAQDFIDLVERHDIAYHEKTLGQLFCDGKSQNIIDMLLDENEAAGTKVQMGTKINAITSIDTAPYRYAIETNRGTYHAESVVIATGGLSIPKIGATKFGYDIARQFDLNIIETRAGLVPLTFTDEILGLCKTLSGISVPANVAHKKISFSEGFLFTHRGFSGPSILQISSYWREGDDIIVNLKPDLDVDAWLKDQRTAAPKTKIDALLSDILPKRLAQEILRNTDHGKTVPHIAECSDKMLESIAAHINHWRVKPAGSEGYRTAEVTIGGVDTNDVSSKTMEARKQSGLFFIGEVLDVTGHLGGYNFQWAWSSGFVAGQNA